MPFDVQLILWPDWVAAVIINLVLIGFSVIGLLVVKKIVHHSILKRHNDVAGFIFATIGVMYAVILAFVVLVVWQKFNSAEQVSQEESSHAFALYRDISMYPDTTAARELRKEFKEYIQSVIENEYPKMEVLQTDTMTIVRFRELFYSIKNKLSPKTNTELAIYSEILKSLNLLAEKRALRMMGTTSSIPPQIWYTIIFGAFLTIGFTFLFGTENFRAQLIMSVCLSILIAMIIFVIMELQYPYSGDLSIRPDGYRMILEWSPM